MADARNKMSMFINYLKAQLGVPLIDIEFEDAEIETFFLAPALLKYYSNRPFVYRVVKIDGGSGVTFVVPGIDSVYTQLSAGDSYFVGIVGIERSPETSVNNYAGDYLQYSFAEIMRDSEGIIMDRQHQATLADVFENDLIATHNYINDTINITPFNGKVSIALGYGLKKIEFVPHQHILILGDIAMLSFIETVRTGRGSVKLPGDVEINEDILSEKYTELQEKVPKLLEDLRIPLLMYA